MKRWERIDQPKEIEQQQQREICAQTKGMHAYGNRVRIAVGVSVEVALLIAELMESTGQTASTICSKALEASLLQKENN